MSTLASDSYFRDVEEHRNGMLAELATRRAFFSRSRALEHLDKHLIDFETHFSRNQGKILWAPRAENGKQEIEQLARQGKVFSENHRLLKELGLNPAEKGWHLYDAYSSNRTLPGAADTAILFPQFYISENGSLLIGSFDPYTEVLLSVCKRVVFVLGIEQVCPTMNEGENLMALLVRAGHGKKEFPAVHFTFGNKSSRERQGPQETYVLLLDNGRSDLLAAIPQRQALYCIHCGACGKFSNRQAAAEDVIESIRLPFTKGPEYFPVSFDFPLSGRSSVACPVGIDLKGLMLENRRVAVEMKKEGRSDALAWKAWKTTMLSRKWLNKGAGVKNFTLKSFFKKQWGEQREFPRVVERSFNEWWLENRGKEEI